MTVGSIPRHLLLFALPLLAGNLFQQLYNMVDTWVVGNFVSNEAFSAVGTVGPIINILIGFFSGLASGAGVVISQYFGARDQERVHKTVETAVTMTLLMGVLFTALGLGGIPLMLRFINMPAEVIPDATAYLQIYFSGVIGLLVYNMGAGILRAVGDSTRPFLYLVVCALLNIVGDLVFVLVFGWGVRGVAYATILSQAVSAILVSVDLLSTPSCVRLSIRDLRLDREILGRIIRVGIPAALQMAITAFSNVFVQGYINAFGADAMSGWTAYAKMDQLIFLPMQSLGLASTTFVGQNLGTGNVARAKKGARVTLLMAVLFTLACMVPVLIFAPQLTAFFNSRPEVVAYGTKLLRQLTPFYLFVCFNQVYANALRGAGNSRMPMIVMLGSFVVFRQIYLFVMTTFISNTLTAVAMAYPAGWFLSSAWLFLYYRRVGFATRHAIVSPKKEPPADS